MPLRKSAGNMYPWVTHTHCHLTGKCQHECTYCYVQAMEHRFGGTRYAGPVDIDEAEFKVAYGNGKTIFLEHMNDIAAPGVQDEWIERVFAHACTWPENKYVIQSKNPLRLLTGVWRFPPHVMFGTTIETNRDVAQYSKARPCKERATGIRAVRQDGHAVFVTVEPIMDFDVTALVTWLQMIRPAFVNIGADSKSRGLPEPSFEKVMQLVSTLAESGIEVREKRNLERLKNA